MKPYNEAADDAVSIACAMELFHALAALVMSGHMNLDGYALHDTRDGIFLKNPAEAKQLLNASLYYLPGNLDLGNFGRALFSPIGVEALACVVSLHSRFPKHLPREQVAEVKEALHKIVRHAVELSVRASPPSRGSGEVAQAVARPARADLSVSQVGDNGVTRVSSEAHEFHTQFLPWRPDADVFGEAAAIKSGDRLFDLVVTKGFDGKFHWEIVDGVTALDSGDHETIEGARRAAENAARRKIFA